MLINYLDRIRAEVALLPVALAGCGAIMSTVPPPIMLVFDEPHISSFFERKNEPGNNLTWHVSFILKASGCGSEKWAYTQLRKTDNGEMTSCWQKRACKHVLYYK